MRISDFTSCLTKIFVCVLYLHFSALALAAEELGTFKLGSLLLEPEYQNFDANGATVPSGGVNGFAIRQAQIAAQWSLDSNFEGVVRAGNLSQLGKVPLTGPSSAFNQDNNQYGVVEAYAQYHTELADLRAGLLPVNFSLEGIMNEGALYFERSLVWRERRVPLRDIGFQIFTTHNDFYTTATLHNGEAGPDQDGRQFLTSTFGYMGPLGLHVGVSGNAGRIIRQNVEFRERKGAVFGSYGGFNTNIQFEIMAGESKSDLQNTQFSTYHIDAAQPLSDSWGIQERFDWMNRDTRATNQVVQEADGGLYFQNPTGTSTVFLLGRWTIDQQVSNNAWAGFIVWRLMSKTRLARDEFSDRVRSAL